MQLFHARLIPPWACAAGGMARIRVRARSRISLIATSRWQGTTSRKRQGGAALHQAFHFRAKSQGKKLLDGGANEIPPTVRSPLARPRPSEVVFIPQRYHWLGAKRAIPRSALP